MFVFSSSKKPRVVRAALQMPPSLFFFFFPPRMIDVHPPASSPRVYSKQAAAGISANMKGSSRPWRHFPKEACLCLCMAAKCKWEAGAQRDFFSLSKKYSFWTFEQDIAVEVLKNVKVTWTTIEVCSSLRKPRREPQTTRAESDALS